MWLNKMVKSDILNVYFTQMVASLKKKIDQKIDPKSIIKYHEISISTELIF